jgi:hypothetical protein
MKKQSEISEHGKLFMEKIEKIVEKKNWAEIGFYIFTGFLVGLMFGSGIFTCVYWILKKGKIQKKDPVTPVLMSEIKPSSTISLRENNVEI